jgi:16S rRNA (adenine1518-N6/adenine1519-N6)-dimethyltransferase
MKNIKAKKSLGQNFLNNRFVLDKMILAGEINENDTVLEIGPGTGNLTEKLVNTNAKIFAIEKDIRMENILKDRFNQFLNFKLIIGDIKVYYSEFLKEINKEFKIIANIPYYLSSFLFRMFFEYDPKPNTIVLMLQKELAERIAKNTIQNNKLRMYINLFFNAKYVTTVKKENFHPRPKVDSAIICLTFKHNNYQKAFINKFEKVINAGFRQPRKMVISNLKSYYQKDLDYKSILEKLNIDIKSRPEQLDFET